MKRSQSCSSAEIWASLIRSRSVTPNGTREVGAEIEELVLNASQHLAHVGGKVSGKRETDVRVQLVDGAERGDPAVELRHPRPVAEARLPAVSPTGVDPGEPHRLIALAGHGHRLRRMEIRPARDDEIEPLTQLFIRARNEMDYLPEVQDEAAVPIAAGFASTRKSGSPRRTAGCSGSSGSSTRRTSTRPVLEKIYVEPAEQNRGVGSALLDKAKELRPAELYLWVFQKNPARRLYERNGFVLVKLTDGADNMEREPDALYRWEGARG